MCERERRGKVVKASGMPDKALFPVLDFKFAFVVVVAVFEAINSYKMEK